VLDALRSHVSSHIELLLGGLLALLHLGLMVGAASGFFQWRDKT
jgi:hypothetical protein